MRSTTAQRRLPRPCAATRRGVMYGNGRLPLERLVTCLVDDQAVPVAPISVGIHLATAHFARSPEVGGLSSAVHLDEVAHQVAAAPGP
jgi:hypothetical protein